MERPHPIFELTNLDHFKQAIRDIVLAHHFSFIHEARIFHRDISLHNLMGDFKVAENANPEDFDDETLGGRVIWDKLWDILAQ
ncbi:hypothetical protein ACEPAI_7522 [Sanghuangporus weigelae]